MNIYFDTEFTGLVPNTTLISLGCVAETGEKFYAEFTDYDESLCDDWIKENVIKNLLIKDPPVKGMGRIDNTGNPLFDYTCDGDSGFIKAMFTTWLEYVNPNKERIQFVSDVCHYDFYLLCNLFGGAFSLPEYVNPVCYDICQDLLNCFHTIDAMSGFPKDLATEMQKCFDISREEVCKRVFRKLPEGKKHNALYDAEVIKLIYEGMRG